MDSCGCVNFVQLLYVRQAGKNEKEKSSAQAEVIALNKADFLLKVYNYEKNQTQWVYEGNKPAIVDFYADWCGPCKKVSPILKELAVQYKDDIVIYKINVDDEKELASAFGIQSIPTLLFIPKTGKPQIAQGALSERTVCGADRQFLA